MLLENVEVMAVGETVTRGASGEGGAETYNSVTLQASVEIVETFLGEFESADGALTLVLRNPCDENPDCVGASQ
jgi:Flp pilus assembly protein CpaB